MKRFFEWLFGFLGRCGVCGSFFCHEGRHCPKHPDSPYHDGRVGCEECFILASAPKKIVKTRDRRLLAIEIAKALRELDGDEK
jgi:hypothetical protein